MVSDGDEQGSMMKKRFYYPIVAAFILPTFFNTAFADYSKEFDQCIDTLGAYSPAVVKCMNEELSKRDKLLNTAYKQYMARIQDFRKEDLRKLNDYGFNTEMLSVACFIIVKVALVV